MTSKKITIPAIYKGSNGVETMIDLELHPSWNNPNFDPNSDPDNITVISKTPGSSFSLYFDVSDVEEAITRQEAAVLGDLQKESVSGKQPSPTA
jgi:hypothetical protein